MLEAVVGAGGIEVHLALCAGLVACVCQNCGQGGAVFCARLHKCRVGGVCHDAAFKALPSRHDRGAGGHADRAACVTVFVADAHCRHIIQVRRKDALIPPCVDGVKALLVGGDQQDIVSCHEKIPPSYSTLSIGKTGAPVYPKNVRYAD